MPGIAGIIGGTEDREVILRMTQTMKYKASYSIDTYVDKNVALGITSLVPGNKITFNATKTLVALMEGEVFGITKGKDETDIEVIIRLYEKEGNNFLTYLTGWFTLALYDCRKDLPAFFLITDRYGLMPLYYTEIGNKFIFASEIKAILAYTHFNKEIDQVGVAEFAIFNYPLGGRTLVKNIQRVPPASILEIKNQKSTQKKYWEIERVITSEVMSSKDSINEGGRVFREVVSNLIKYEPQVGLTLTAGYDTRAILAALHNLRVSKVNCFTYGKKTDIQSIVASKLAQLLGYEWRGQEFGANFVKRIPNFLARTVWITDGLCNIVHCGLLYAFEDMNVPYPYFFGYGGSELIRGLQNTSLALSENSKKIILSNNITKTWLNIINTPNSYGFFSYEFYRKYASECQFPMPYYQLPIQQRAFVFMMDEIFRKYYWSIIRLIETEVRVRLPYMAHEFIEFVLRTPYSILHTYQFSHNPVERLKGQKFSASIIKYNTPALLYILTDRGYKPYYNLHWVGYPIIFFSKIQQRVWGSELPLLRENVKNILDNITPRDYYNLSGINKVIESYPNWSLFEWQELTKLLTFELWVKQFMD